MGGQCFPFVAHVMRSVFIVYFFFFFFDMSNTRGGERFELVTSVSLGVVPAN